MLDLLKQLCRIKRCLTEILDTDEVEIGLIKNSSLHIVTELLAIIVKSLFISIPLILKLPFPLSVTIPSLTIISSASANMISTFSKRPKMNLIKII